VGIDKAATVGLVALIGAGTAFFVGALVLSMALDLGWDATDAAYLSLAGVAGGVGLGLAGAVGALLVGVFQANVAPDR
jgi:hypothetical protein